MFEFEWANGNTDSSTNQFTSLSVDSIRTVSSDLISPMLIGIYVLDIPESANANCQTLKSFWNLQSENNVYICS